MLVGSTLQAYGSGSGGAGAKGDAGFDHGRAKLERIRAADVVVATAGAFEHCMFKVGSSLHRVLVFS